MSGEIRSDYFIANAQKERLLVRIAVRPAGAEVVPAAPSQKAEANAPLKQDGSGEGVLDDTDLVREIAFMRAGQLDQVPQVIRKAAVLPVQREGEGTLFRGVVETSAHSGVTAK